MKKTTFVIAAILLLGSATLSGQDSQDLVSKCALSLGENSTYLKDFVIKLKEAPSGTQTPVHKANIYLMKNQTYLFTMCSGEDSSGELVLQLYDKDKMIISSYNRNSGKVYGSFELACKKTGLYTLWYSFSEGKSGNGVGIVSLVR